MNISNLEKDIKFRILNELDNNPNVRMVFAIDMLNEGWDVLSLFDIVKIDDVSADTTKEAQLIGRGARIFPFNYLNHDKFKRKFDNDLGNPLRKLETLNFFTANDSSYINKIKNELNSMGFNIQNNPITQIKVRIDKKEKFGNYYVFNNEVLNFNKIDIFKLKEISINESFKSSISSVDDLNIKNLLEKTNPSQIFEQYIHVFQWCLNKTTIDLMPIKFYTKLNSYDLLLNIFNQNNFIINTDKEWETLTWLEMTQCIQPLVDKSLKNLLKNINSKIGSKNLQGKKILDLFVDYMTTTDKVKNINNPIYYYEKLTLDSPLEEELHNTVFKNLNSENYVVIRNEGKLKFYSTEIDNSGDGFEPDFIVLKIDPNQHNHYHLFYLEVKGDGFIHKDKWKQDLLLNLVDNKLIDINNEFYHLHGFEFFSENNKNQWINTYFSQF